MLSVLFHFAALDEESGNADKIGIGGIEAHVLNAKGERALHHIQQRCRILVDVACDRENIAYARREIMMELRAVAQMVGKRNRLVADRDAYTGRNALVAVEPNLRCLLYTSPSPRDS